MSLPVKLEKFLRKNKVQYEIIVHPERFTSSEIAEVEHVSGDEVAKVVMLKANGRDVMAVLPASHSIDFLKLSTVLGTQDVRIESENEFAGLFPDCEAGAMPPFGKLYDMPCYVDESLMGVERVAFNGGNHKESIRVWAKDFFRVLKAVSGDFSVKARALAV